MKKFCSILLLSLICVAYQQINAQILITEDESGTPHPSAMLEIQSTDKGLLIPRMTSMQRESISNPQEGLLVYDSDLGSFFIFGKSISGEPAWNDLSTPGGIWQTNSNNVYLSSSYTNVGIGTGSNPAGKLVIKADPMKAPDDVLFEIQDNLGNPVFVVTSEGARLYIKDLSKGASGGFAVGRYGIAKGIPDTTYFMVSPDSTRVYTNDAKGSSGGFAVGRYGIAKDKKNYFFYTGIDSTRVYANDGMKGSSGGFAVGRYGIAKGVEDYSFYTAKDSTRIYTDSIAAKGSSGGFAVGRYGIAKGNTYNYMYMVPANYLIGHQAGELLQTGDYTGIFNTFFGYQSGMNDTTGSNNLFLGYQSGFSNTQGNSNVFSGYQSGYSNTTADYNVFTGFQSGFSNSTAGYNTFTGFRSGYRNTTGTHNSF